MLRFFRLIRRKLLEEQKLRQYTYYAIGEIFLVVIGILIALQINNWNEDRKKDNQFNSALNQAYNDIIFDKLIINDLQGMFSRQIAMIDTLLKLPDYYPIEELPGRLIYIDQPFKSEISWTETNFQNNSFNRISGLSDEQSRLSQKVISYLYGSANYHNVNQRVYKSPIHDLLEANHIPTPPLSQRIVDFLYPDYQSKFTETHLRKVRELLSSEELRAALITIKTLRESAIPALENSLTEVETLQNAMRDHFPGISFTYSEIGLVGSALPIGWDPSSKIPMKRDHSNGFLYEVELEFKDGHIKIVADDNWAVNWGMTLGEENKLSFLGADIPVQKGKHLVRIDFEKNTFEIIKLEDN